MPRPKKTIAQRERARRARERKERLDAALATTLETRRADPYNIASWDTRPSKIPTKLHHATKKTTAELDREIAEALAGKPVCAGLDASGITAMPLTEAKRRSAAEVERCYLASVLERAGGSVSEGARLAGLDRTNFRRLLHRHGIR